MSLGEFYPAANDLEVSRASPLGGSVKRAFDISFALTAAIIFLPLILLTALAIRISSGRPVLYRHKRVGFRGKEFECLKFRTMVTNGDSALLRHFQLYPEARKEWDDTRKLSNDPRVSQLGRVLRKTSLDELPQLLNILRGDMSLVGPRPVVRDELRRYGGAVSCYLRARPGLTGPWQVNGRSDTTYFERVTLDTHYVNNWSLFYDFWIIIRTVPAVVLVKGSR
ncbi:sugar transferase [Microvirga sp. 3-52]|nr:sugar transferase [Microvirga sp. 3-52]